EVRMGLLATGRLLTILATSILRFPTRRRELKILPVELPIASVPNGIFTLKNRTLSPVARLFIEHAREVANPLAKKKSEEATSAPGTSATSPVDPPKSAFGC